MNIQELVREYHAGNRDFRGVDLSGFALYGFDLNEVNFQRANLSKVKLIEANLQSCNLSESTLNDADLTGADLNQSNLNWASLIGATLNRATFFADNPDVCASLSEIAQRLGRSIHAVRPELGDLVLLGILDQVQASNGQALYQLTKEPSLREMTLKFADRLTTAPWFKDLGRV